MLHRRPRGLATYLVSGTLLFAIIVAIVVTVADGRVGGLLSGGGPTPDPRWRAIATEQASSFDAPMPVVTRTPRAANGAGTPPSKPAATAGSTRAIPTMMPSLAASAPTPALAAPTPTPADLIARLARAEADLRSGEFTGAIEYANGQHASSTVRFALGTTPGQGRLYLTSTYRGTTGERRIERVIIDDRSWERAGAGGWESVPTGESVADLIGALLPGSGYAGAVTGTMSSPGEVALGWQDRESGVLSRCAPIRAPGYPRA